MLVDTELSLCREVVENDHCQFPTDDCTLCAIVFPWRETCAFSHVRFQVFELVKGFICGSRYIFIHVRMLNIRDRFLRDLPAIE